MNKVKVTLIGGGTGSVAVSTGLKRYEDLDLKVIVSMTDDGGSNKVVRDEFGLLPLSDLRKSIIALAGHGNGTFRKLFTYRFDKGEGLSGHTLGNLIMMALSDLTGSEEGAVEAASDIFDVKGEIIPVTFDLVKLCAKYEDGQELIGEHNIDTPGKEMNTKLKELYLAPTAKANRNALDAIKNSQYIILGPGYLYTSLLSNIIVEGMAEAIQASKAKFVYITNLMSENGETRGMSLKDTVEDVAKYAGRKPDLVLVNNGYVPVRVLRRYKKSGEHPLEDDLGAGDGYEVVREDIISKLEPKKDKGDTLDRSLIRHDALKLGRLLYKLITY